MNQENISLSIDTSIGEGSFSLWKGDILIYSQIGNEINSRSIDILQIIEKILLAKKFRKEQIKEIVFTKGPGSYTGIRVGISSMLGLGFALNASLHTVSVFEAYTILSTNYENCFSAMCLSNREILVQDFKMTKISTKNPPFKIKTDKLLKYLRVDQTRCLVIDKTGYEKMKNNFLEGSQSTNIIPASDNVSKLAYKHFRSHREPKELDYFPSYSREF